MCLSTQSHEWLLFIGRGSPLISQGSLGGHYHRGILLLFISPFSYWLRKEIHRVGQFGFLRRDTSSCEYACWDVGCGVVGGWGDMWQWWCTTRARHHLGPLTQEQKGLQVPTDLIKRQWKCIARDWEEPSLMKRVRNVWKNLCLSVGWGIHPQKLWGLRFKLSSREVALELSVLPKGN